jgi:hypothetical protein
VGSSGDEILPLAFTLRKSAGTVGNGLIKLKIGKNGEQL